jgi:hypothetical protein
VRLQPDNGSAWVPVFNAAWKANDSAAAESALARMALARHFDEQYATVFKAWLDVDKRYPRWTGPPVRYFGLALDASSYANGLGLPDYGPLLDACRSERPGKESPSRFRECAQVGRLMLTQSTSLFTKLVGRALLRESAQTTEADLVGLRDAMWQYEKWTSALPDRRGSSDRANAEGKDWLETGDETQVMQRGLRRLGIPLTPSVDWQPEHLDTYFKGATLQN